jgi:hypothetical protein
MRLVLSLPIVIVITLAFATGVARAKTPTPVPDSVPTAPRDVVVDYERHLITWTDVATNNETAYRVAYTITGRRANTVTLEAPANATSLAIPADAPRLYCGAQLRGTMVAFNSLGESPAVTLDYVGVCPPTSPSPTMNVGFDWQDFGTRSAVVISWTNIAGATSYSLTGKFRVAREAASGQCDPPLQVDVREIDLSQEVRAPGTSYSIDLPHLPEHDVWTVLLDSGPVIVAALDRYGEPLVSIGQASIREGCGFGDAQRAITLPSTGRHDAAAPGPGASAERLALLGVSLLSLGWALRARRWRDASAASANRWPVAQDDAAFAGEESFHIHPIGRRFRRRATFCDEALSAEVL